jgi:hypothetical protein
VKNMVVANRNLMTTPEICHACSDCKRSECQLCAPCLQEHFVEDLKMAYKEHLNKLRCKRVFPPKMVTIYSSISGVNIL